MVYRIAIAAKVEITPAMATCLYTAILSDTGSFTYSSTNAETFALAHDLAARGANPSQIARDLYFSNPASKIRLLGTRPLQPAVRWPPRLELGHQCTTWIRPAPQPKTAKASSTTSSASPASSPRSSSASSPPPSQFRLSIRSKGKVDVAQIAESLRRRRPPQRQRLHPRRPPRP